MKRVWNLSYFFNWEPKYGMEKRCDMTGLGRPEDEPSIIVLNLWSLSRRCFGEPERRALQESNLESTNAQITVFVASSEKVVTDCSDFAELKIESTENFWSIMLKWNTDAKGDSTYVSTHGCSVSDYCLVFDSFVDRIAKFAVCDRVESSHMPRLFEIAVAQDRHGPTVT